MKSYKSFVTAALGAIVLMMVLACGGSSTPVPISGIPIYPGATDLETGDNPLVDMIVGAMEETAAEDETIEAQFAFYALPEDTSWDDVKRFYNDKMEESDWKATDEILEESDVFSMIGWERSKQAVGVGYVPAGSEMESATLLIMLATEN